MKHVLTFYLKKSRSTFLNTTTIVRDVIKVIGFGILLQFTHASFRVKHCFD